ncbi:MAG: type II secretion system protein M [Nitrospirae bacterium]|nr:type II secretion system protein M [Nitrospirota bacterium]
MRERLVALWRERNDRERLVLGLGAAAVAIMLGYGLVIDPLLARSARLDRLIVQRQADLERVTRLVGEYREAEGRVTGSNRAIASPGTFSLLSFLEETASGQQVRNRLVSIRPQPTQALPPYHEVSAELKMESVTLPQVVAYLTALDHAPQRIRVKSVRLKTRYADPKLLDGSFVVATYEKIP